MFKKIFFALTLLFVGAMGGAVYSDKASALELDHNSEIYKKIIRQNIKACYREEPLYSKVFPKDWPNDEFYGLFGDALWVGMPTGYTPLEDNFVTCKGLIYGDKIGSGAKGEYAGVLNLYGKDISNTTGLETKKKLAVGLGYEKSADGELDNPDAPLYYALAYTYNSYEKWRGCGFLYLGMCEENSGPYDAATYVTGTKVNNDGTVASKLEIFASGNGTTIEDAGISFRENSQRTGGTFSIECTDFWEQWKKGFLNDVFTGINNSSSVDGWDCESGDFSVSYNNTIWNDGDARSGNNASENSVVGFLNKHLPLNFSIAETQSANYGLNYYYRKDTYTVTGTISSDPNYVERPTNITLPGQYNKIGSWDDRAVKGMEYFTGGTNRIFTDPEIYILYVGYLTDYYKADFQCGADKAEYYAGREGYIRASNLLYEGEMQNECYVKATENADKEVNGVSFYNFNGADRGGGMVFYGQKTFAELLAQIADLDVTPESIAEANITSTKNEDNETGSDPCFSNSGSLGWVVCPVITWLGDTLGSVYTDMVEPFLVINGELIAENTTYGESATHRVWGVFRNIADILFVILFLVVILSQLTGVGIDNYGIKKILPKLIVAAILINLSYYICQIVVDVSNILGSGLNNMFTSIAGGIPSSFTGDFNSGTWFKWVLDGMLTVLGIGGAVGVIVVVASNGISAIILPLLMGLIIAFIAVIFFFVLLGVRKAGVIALVALSPLAFVCYMLPNTKGLFDKWKKAFEGLLLVYPICGALIGGSVLVSRALIQTDDFLVYLMGLLLLVVPFFFVPVLLKSSFAAMGNIGAKISNFGNRFGRGLARRTDKGIRNSEAFKRADNAIGRHSIFKQRRAKAVAGTTAMMRERAERDRLGDRKNMQTRIASIAAAEEEKAMDEQTSQRLSLMMSSGSQGGIKMEDGETVAYTLDNLDKRMGQLRRKAAREGLNSGDRLELSALARGMSNMKGGASRIARNIRDADMTNAAGKKVVNAGFMSAIGEIYSRDSAVRNKLNEKDVGASVFTEQFVPGGAGLRNQRTGAAPTFTSDFKTYKETSVYKKALADRIKSYDLGLNQGGAAVDEYISGLSRQDCQTIIDDEKLFNSLDTDVRDKFVTHAKRLNVTGRSAQPITGNVDANIVNGEMYLRNNGDGEQDVDVNIEGRDGNGAK